MTNRPTRLLPTLVVGALVAPLMALAGCASDEGVAAPPTAVEFTAAADVPVVVPGGPGEPTTTIAPGETGSMENPARWSDGDVAFLEAMVPHHTQALRMSDLAADRAADERVLGIAERISLTQGPEIDAMQGWLVGNGLPEADPDDHGHDSMVGMASTEEMLALDAARGDEFDALFLDMMTRHHEGAVQMASEVTDMTNPVVIAMVEDTAVSQTIEIARMQEILADL